jgi:DNA transposition AAA+ family ATPase
MLRDEQPVTPEAIEAIKAQFTALLTRIEKTNTWAARSLGISESVLSQVMSGTYAGDSEKHIRQIDKWVETQILRETAPRPAGFVKTKIAERIYATARWVSEINAIGVVHGPAGIGKTITLQAIRAETPGSVFIRVMNTGISQLAVLESIAPEIRLGSAPVHCNELSRAIISKLKGTNRLIIVDEIHKLVGRSKDAALHCLREIHDETECPMLWSGMSNFADYIQSGVERFEPLDQINSRIKYWLNLRDLADNRNGGPGLYTVEDIRKWINAMKIRVADDAIRYLQMLANTPGMGALRTCDGLMRIAQKFQARAGGDKPITAQMLREIRGEQFGVMAAEQFDKRMELRIAKVG